MTKTVFINDSLGIRTYDRPTKTLSGNPIPTDSDTLLIAYGWRTEQETLPDPAPTEAEQKAQRIAQLKADLAIGYEQMVINAIRKQYTIDEELALQRQRDTKTADFNAYFTYCEQCKQAATTQIEEWQKELNDLEPVTEE